MSNKARPWEKFPPVFENVPVSYVPDFVPGTALCFERLTSELIWTRRGQTPRDEYYWNVHPMPYTYGHGENARTYIPQPDHEILAEIRRNVESWCGCKFEVCFLNRYQDGKDQLGWHADDSPNMDDARPIAIVSLGAEREIWFKCSHAEDPQDVSKLLLGNGSLAIMEAGMQDTHVHRIPKSDRHNCGPRISLTFRGLVL